VSVSKARHAGLPTIRSDNHDHADLARSQIATPVFGLRDEAARDGLLRPETTEPAVALMTMGREVVEDYRLEPACPPARLSSAKSAGSRIPALHGASQCPGRKADFHRRVVLVRQMPGSAKGVMFTNGIQSDTAARFLAASKPHRSPAE
jgi:hypothetical protein